MGSRMWRACPIEHNLCGTHWSRQLLSFMRRRSITVLLNRENENQLKMVKMVLAQERSQHHLCEWWVGGDGSCRRRCVISQSRPPGLWSLIVLASENQMTTMIKMLSGHLIRRCVCDQPCSKCDIKWWWWWRWFQLQRKHISCVSDGSCRRGCVISQSHPPSILTCDHWSSCHWLTNLTRCDITDHNDQLDRCNTNTTNSCMDQDSEVLSNICDLILCPLFGCLWCIVQAPIVQPRWIHCRSHALLLPNWHMAESITQCRPKRR